MLVSIELSPKKVKVDKDGKLMDEYTGIKRMKRKTSMLITKKLSYQGGRKAQWSITHNDVESPQKPQQLSSSISMPNLTKTQHLEVAKEESYRTSMIKGLVQQAKERSFYQNNTTLVQTRYNRRSGFPMQA